MAFCSLFWYNKYIYMFALEASHYPLQILYGNFPEVKTLNYHLLLYCPFSLVIQHVVSRKPHVLSITCSSNIFGWGIYLLKYLYYLQIKFRLVQVFQLKILLLEKIL